MARRGSGAGVTLYLVRHGRPAIDTSRPAAEWELDPAGYDDVWALRASGRLPAAAPPDLDRWQELAMPDLLVV